MRYKLAPSLIAAGRTVQTAGFPLTARTALSGSLSTVLTVFELDLRGHTQP